jgi:hypothetical protein
MLDPATLAGAALNVVLALESVSGVPIAMVSGAGADPAANWKAIEEAVCAKADGALCGADVTFMTRTTNPLGFSTSLFYDKDGARARVCVVVLPAEDLSPSVAATGISGGGIFVAKNLPSQAEMKAWLVAYNAARCLDEKHDAAEEKRAEAFATMTLGLIEGDPAFVSGAKSGPRTFSFMRDHDLNRWAANVSERILLELWKKETAEALKASGCPAQAVASASFDTDQIARASALAPESQCGGAGVAQVTDENLHLWMFGGAAGVRPVGAPPTPWTPMKPFESYADGVAYAWKTAGKLASQY